MEQEMKESLRAIVREEISKALSGRGLNNDLLTRDEAAVILKIKSQTLALWATKNIGPAPTRVGGCVRYRRSVLEAYVLKNTMPR